MKHRACLGVKKLLFRVSHHFEGHSQEMEDAYGRCVRGGRVGCGRVSGDRFVGKSGLTRFEDMI